MNENVNELLESLGIYNEGNAPCNPDGDFD